VQEEQWAGQRISSTWVRERLKAGDLVTASQLLNRPYSLCGRVIHGDQRGRALGIPTANIPLGRKVSPLHGIFAVKVYGIAPHPLCGAANIGTRPMFDNRWLLEVHIFAFEREIYGKMLKIEFYKKLREESSFASVDLLVAQMQQDIADAKEFFRNAYERL
jgi:riboflavin kinase/FMN adenylyltransferase